MRFKTWYQETVEQPLVSPIKTPALKSALPAVDKVLKQPEIAKTTTPIASLPTPRARDQIMKTVVPKVASKLPKAGEQIPPGEIADRVSQNVTGSKFMVPKTGSVAGSSNG